MVARTPPLGEESERDPASIINPMGRLTVARDALLHETTKAYDLQGDLVARTDPLLRATVYEYDAEQQLAQERREYRAGLSEEN